MSGRAHLLGNMNGPTSRNMTKIRARTLHFPLASGDGLDGKKRVTRSGVRGPDALEGRQRLACFARH